MSPVRGPEPHGPAGDLLVLSLHGSLAVLSLLGPIPSTCLSQVLFPPHVPWTFSVPSPVPSLCSSQVLSPPCVPPGTPSPPPPPPFPQLLSPPGVPPRCPHPLHTSFPSPIFPPCPPQVLSLHVSPCPPTHPWARSPIGVKDLKAVDVKDADDCALAVQAGIIAAGVNAGVDAPHNPAEEPLIDGLGTGWWAPKGAGGGTPPSPHVPSLPWHRHPGRRRPP